MLDAPDLVLVNLWLHRCRLVALLRTRVASGVAEQRYFSGVNDGSFFGLQDSADFVEFLVVLLMKLLDLVLYLGLPVEVEVGSELWTALLWNVLSWNSWVVLLYVLQEHYPVVFLVIVLRRLRENGQMPVLLN